MKAGDTFLLVYTGANWAVDRLIPHETGRDETYPDYAVRDLMDVTDDTSDKFSCIVSKVATEDGDVWQATRITASKSGQGATPTDAVFDMQKQFETAA